MLYRGDELEIKRVDSLFKAKERRHQQHQQHQQDQP
jgi:hypothetical protein